MPSFIRIACAAIGAALLLTAYAIMFLTGWQIVAVTVLLVAVALLAYGLKPFGFGS